jgi:D-alanine-D-alanine ligase
MLERKLKVTVLYDAVEDVEREKAAARDEPPQKLVYETIGEALRGAGHEVRALGAGSTALELAAQIQRDDADLVFNVCESFGGSNQQEQNVAALLELFGKRFTGSGSIGLALAQDKALAKKLLSFHGINTPKFSVIEGGEVDHADDLTFPMFVKPSNADASIGIDEHSVVHNFKELMERMSYIKTELDAPVLIEEYIEGRELYVGVLGGARPEPMPVLEWDFSKVPDGTPKIASAEAKWDAQSTRFREAPQLFPEDLPPQLVTELQKVAVNAYKALKLRDYGRIDMRLRKRDAARVTLSGKPRKLMEEHTLADWEIFLIEVNPNPHLAADSELPVSAVRHGLSYSALIERIIDNALQRPVR